MADLGLINVLVVTVGTAVPNVYSARSFTVGTALNSGLALLDPDVDIVGTAALAPDVVANPCYLRDGSVLRDGTHDHGATCVPVVVIDPPVVLDPDADIIGTAAPLPDVVANPCHLRDGSVLRDGTHDHGATCVPVVVIDPPVVLDPDADIIGTAAPLPDVVANPCHLRDGSVLRNGEHDHGATCLPVVTPLNPNDPVVLLNPAATPTGSAADAPIAPVKKQSVADIEPTSKTVLRRYGVAGSVGIDRQTGQVINGLAYLRDRMASCLSMRLGTHPMRRLKGSRIPELIDRPMNSATIFELQVAAVDALSSVQNGFEDLKVLRAVVDAIAPGKVNFSVVFEQHDLPETMLSVEVPV